MRYISLLLVAVLASAQQTPPPAPAAPAANSDDDFKITTNTQLVIETVVVREKGGKGVEGLTAKDFTITEDGKPQVISFCEYQALKDSPDAAPPAEAELEPALA